ncbi:MAG: hypothetical protein K0S92_1275 [Desertimonas sp.]|nr:hypothetical protein [Desertimonas sp.]
MTAPRLAAAAIVLSTVTAIAGTTLADATSIDDRSPDKTIPTLPSTTAGPATSGSSTTGIGLPAQASLPQFFPVVNNVIGATGDVASELSVVADVPEGILSPDGSSIRQFSVVYDASNQQFVATATFSSDATAEDAVVFFQATLSAAGFTPVADSGAPEGNETSRELRFENPNSTLDGAGVEVVVDEGDPTDIELTITDSIGADVLNAFTGWAAGMPLVQASTPLAASIDVATDPGSGDLTLTLTTQFAVSGYTPDELAAALRSALPAGGFSLDADSDPGTGTTLALHHLAMDDVAVEVGADNSGSATLTLSASVTI